MDIVYNPSLGGDEIFGFVSFPEGLEPDNASTVDFGYDEKAAYSLTMSHGSCLKMVFMKGRWRCCAARAHLVNPVLLRDGDKFGIFGNDEAGNPVVIKLTRTQVLCLLGRDKKNLCGCGRGR